MSLKSHSYTSIAQGEDATKSAYVEKLDKLKAVGGPAAFRYKENEDRPAAVKRLRETLSKYYTKATGSEERYAHLTEVGLVFHCSSFIVFNRLHK